MAAAGAMCCTRVLARPMERAWWSRPRRSAWAWLCWIPARSASWVRKASVCWWRRAVRGASCSTRGGSTRWRRHPVASRCTVGGRGRVSSPGARTARRPSRVWWHQHSPAGRDSSCPSERWPWAPPSGRVLAAHADTPIHTYIKGRADASPHDGDLVYWASRLGYHPELSRSKAALLKTTAWTV
jgi:hypothetical protein